MNIADEHQIIMLGDFWRGDVKRFKVNLVPVQNALYASNDRNNEANQTDFKGGFWHGTCGKQAEIEHPAHDEANARSVIDEQTVIIFDELIINKGWQQDEFKALNEFCALFDLRYEVLALSLYTKQVVTRILPAS